MPGLALGALELLPPRVPVARMALLACDSNDDSRAPCVSLWPNSAAAEPHPAAAGGAEPRSPATGAGSNPRWMRAWRMVTDPQPGAKFIHQRPVRGAKVSARGAPHEAADPPGTAKAKVVSELFRTYGLRPGLEPPELRSQKHGATGGPWHTG